METLNRLIEILCRERDEVVPPLTDEQKPALFRALCNVRPPAPVSDEFLALEADYLQAVRARRGVTDWRSLTPVQDGLYLWRGDITTLRCDAIVNAANSQMLGCFHPNHGCIDNAIHSFAGVQLRSACAELMARQGHEEPTGSAKLTPAFHLPSRYVLHTVGPIVYAGVTPREEEQLASCYRACLTLAEAHGLGSVAFCCISTGEYRFPNQRAAQIAVQTVHEHRARTHSPIEVIFNVFQPLDYAIYQRLLTAPGASSAGD